MRIADLHCDLLLYLAANWRRTPNDLAVRCAIPQLRKGNVHLQVCAIFTETNPESVKKGEEQLKIFKDLPINYPKDFVHFSKWNDNIDSQINLLMAFENASGFCSENESLQSGIARLEKIMHSISKPFYISLTWNSENRFGGGALSRVGLKTDGKYFLDFLDKRQIAIDLSHASDALAHDTIDYIIGKNLDIPLLASHSNGRKIMDVPRNLPDEIAKEIFRRKGIIGFNLYGGFIGDSASKIVHHFAHWLELGGENFIGFGADFFYEGDLPPLSQANYHGYLSGFEDSSCYGRLLELLQTELKLAESTLEKFAHGNLLNFYTKAIL